MSSDPLVNNKNFNDLKDFFGDTVMRDLEHALESASENGTKSIVIFFQPHIIASLSILVDLTRVMDAHTYIKGWFALDFDTSPPQAAEVVVYVLNPIAQCLEKVVRHFRSYRSTRSPTPKFLFVPEKTVMSEQVLGEDYELREAFSGMEVGTLDFDIQFIDKPHLCMRIPHSFMQVFGEGDLSILRWVSNFLVKAQTTLLGGVSHLVTVGHMSKRVSEMLVSMEREVATMVHIEPTIEKLFVVDRSVDTVTPLLTQLTYEGLLEELYGADCCQVTFPFSIEEAGTGEEKRFFSGISDTLFSELRDKNFTKVGAHIFEKSLAVKEKYEKRKELVQIKEIREYVERLPELQETHRLIGIHTTIAKNVGKLTQNPMFRKQILIEKYILQQINDREVLDYIQELINRKNSFTLVLRLLCLYSVVNGGIRGRDYDLFKEKLMLSFGVCETVSAFLTLSKSGLLSRSRGKASEYSQWQRHGMGYRSSEDAVCEEITDLYGEYCPPLLRLLDLHLSMRSGRTPGTGRQLSSLLDSLSSEVHQVMPLAGMSPSLAKPCTTMLVVIGGLTSAEVSGMRALQKKYPQLPLIVCSTDITSGNRIIESMLSPSG